MRAVEAVFHKKARHFGSLCAAMTQNRHGKQQQRIGKRVTG
jgi:hypothetical protein